MELSSIQYALKAAAEHSNTLIEWALLMYAGSVAAIVSTSYVRPQNRNLRKIYLLFVPAWLFLGISIRCGRLVNGRHLASLFAREEFQVEIRKEMMGDLQNQITFLEIGMLFLAAWLLVFTLWWIFGKWQEKK